MKLSAKSGHGPEQVYVYPMLRNCYLNITNHCNLRCHFCPRIKGEWEVQDYNLRLEREPDADELVAAVMAAGSPASFQEVVFCGLGEPTLRLDVLLAAGRELRQCGFRVRLNTNGLANQAHGYDVTPQLAEAVDAVSISLNAQDETVYERHCRPLEPGAYPALLDFIQRARQRIADVTVTAIDGLPDVDIPACARIAAELGVRFRARVLNEVG